MGAACGTYGRQESCIQYIIGGPEGKRPLGITRLRWENNIKMYRQEVGWRVMDWTDLAHSRDRRRALVKALTLWRQTTYIYVVPHS